jgi:hypothetical protein
MLRSLIASSCYKSLSFRSHTIRNKSLPDNKIAWNDPVLLRFAKEIPGPFARPFDQKQA